MLLSKAIVDTFFDFIFRKPVMATKSAEKVGEIITCRDDTDLPGEVTRMLADIASGGDYAIVELYPQVEDVLRRLAEAQFRKERNGHTLQPTLLVNEAYMRLVQQARRKEYSSLQFRRLAALVMRHILIDHANKQPKDPDGRRRVRVTWDDRLAGSEEPSVDFLALHEALAKLAELDKRRAQVVHLRFFGGMTYEEVAEALSISVRTAKNDWRAARAWLYSTLRDR